MSMQEKIPRGELTEAWDITAPRSIGVFKSGSDMRKLLSIVLAAMLIAASIWFFVVLRDNGEGDSDVDGVEVVDDGDDENDTVGSGTRDDPYLVFDVLDLQNLSQRLGAHYALAGDIDASATVTWNEGAGFKPLGFFLAQFSGSLDGRGYNITGLYINRTDEENASLFGVMGYGGTVRDMRLLDVDITGYEDVGGFAGHSYNGRILNSSVYGSVRGEKNVGGLVGRNEGIINNSYSSADITGRNSVGGLVGRNSGGGVVENSYAIGDVEGDNNIGGLVGINMHGHVSRSYATGNVEGDSKVGGLVGTNMVGTIYKSYAAGNVEAETMMVGGLVGDNWVGDVLRSYARGEVTGGAWAGGLVGHNSGTISNSYSVGAVNAGWFNAGGLVGGEDGGTVSHSFWDTETSGRSRSSGGTGKTTAEMKTQSTFDPPWDFEKVWWMTEDVTYPQLRWQ